MAVMISGGSGFVGLNLVEALLTRGEHVVVTALDDLPASTRAVFAKLPGKLDTEKTDIRDTDAFANLLRRYEVDRLFPFAAITSGPEREREMPERVIEVNLLGFISQLRAARDAGVAKVIAPASGAVYGESFYTNDLVHEYTTPCLPTGIYGVTKYAVERSALRLADLWSMDVVVARIGSLFGPWERDTGLRDMIGPHWNIARHAVAGREAVLPAMLPAYTWVYSRDLAAGLLHLLDAPALEHRVFNICSGTKWGPVITQFADRLTKTFPGFTWRQSADPAEVTVRLTDYRDRGTMDIARISATGWTPRFQPDAAYDDYAAWLHANPNALES
jgi:nucleoside-diphosphate-sugar epimerase